MTETLIQRLHEALATENIDQKPVLAQQLCDDWRAGKFALPAVTDEAILLVHGIPPRTEVVAGSKVPRRSPATPEGRAALLHAVAHIELNAVDLHWDIIARFSHVPMPLGFYDDWVKAGFMVGAVVLIGIGSALYLTCGLGPGPRDGLMTGLHRRLGVSVVYVRLTLEVIVLVIGWLLGGTVGIGTAFFAGTIGFCIGASLHAVDWCVRKWPV